MKLGVLIPTRGDRGKFLNHSKFLLSQQTIKPDEINIVDFKPVDGNRDITKRYRIGCEDLFNNKKCDLVVFWEDDDWYSPKYLETIKNNWISSGKPQIIGIGKTIYYHILTKKYLIVNHPHKSSACCTAVTKDIFNIKFPPDNYPYLDKEIWGQVKSKTVINVNEFYHVGIKHGIGLVGGGGHPVDWPKYENEDTNSSFLHSIIDKESIKFYSSL
jgi:hypothetical protein